MKFDGTRPPNKAYEGWYNPNAEKLSDELDDWLAEVPTELSQDEQPHHLKGSDLPVPGARAIIAPHAGYAYCGDAAAWAYAALDLSKAKRVFILGPSHTYPFQGCALTTFAFYQTPFGNLVVDQQMTEELQATGQFSLIPRTNDVEEHSLEMHTPYLWKRLEQTFGPQSAKSDAAEDEPGAIEPSAAAEDEPGAIEPSAAEVDDKAVSRPWPKIIPVLVGTTNRTQEKEFGKLLLPYLEDPENAFIVSSDFCHWGLRFRYTAYIPGGPDMVEEIEDLRRRSRLPTKPTISESIEVLDKMATAAIETGSHDAFVDNLKLTENSVCGRHPIGVVTAGLEALGGTKEGKGVFKFVKYKQSSTITNMSQTSVSYGSAYAVF